MFFLFGYVKCLHECRGGQLEASQIHWGKEIQKRQRHILPFFTKQIVIKANVMLCPNKTQISNDYTLKATLLLNNALMKDAYPEHEQWSVAVSINIFGNFLYIFTSVENL